MGSKIHPRIRLIYYLSLGNLPSNDKDIKQYMTRASRVCLAKGIVRTPRNMRRVLVKELLDEQ